MLASLLGQSFVVITYNTVDAKYATGRDAQMHIYHSAIRLSMGPHVKRRQACPQSVLLT